MGLGPNRQVFQTNIDYAMNMAGERGGVVCAGTTAGEVEYRTAPTGSTVYPIGVMLDDVEDMNFDRHPEYRQRNVVDVGSVVGLVVKGDIESNLIVGTPSQGQPAYLHPTGYIGATRLTDGLNPAPQVGRFLSAKNALGYAKIHIDL
jgi:hypothetical protein